jgi:hypothetical protein
LRTRNGKRRQQGGNCQKQWRTRKSHRRPRGNEEIHRSTTRKVTGRLVFQPNQPKNRQQTALKKFNRRRTLAVRT